MVLWSPINCMCKMKHIALSLLLSLFYVQVLIASVSTGLPRTFIQPDNSKITLTLRGDERCHFYYTTDNIPVILKDDGTICYVTFQDDIFVTSDVMAHEEWDRLPSEKAFIEHNIEKVRKALYDLFQSDTSIQNTRRLARLPVNRVGTIGNYTGKKKGLVILVNFANLTMIEDNAQQAFDDMFNKEGYNENGHVGSVHDYFYDQSYGMFDLSFDVVGPVTMENNYGYYGKNSEVYGGDMNVREMVIESCKLADKEVNFADYDWDDDGIVEQVFLVYAGYGEHADAPANTIWPHESVLGRELILDGVKINTYACSCELSGNRGKIMNGIGTACHEFSHCLGYPDLYDTDYSDAFGMCFWDLMDSGSHSGPNRCGERPYGYSAYERWCAGWLDLKEIDSTQHIDKLKSLAETPTAYIIYNEGDKNEYFILENHQNDKWYKYTGIWEAGHGLMVTHVDYNELAWKLNLVNPSLSHQRFSIIPADNRYDKTEDGLLGDLYPGKSNVVLIDNNSHRDSGGKLFNPNIDCSYDMNKPICNIVENEKGEISFDVFVGKNALPVALEFSENSQEGFVAHWSEADDAESYNITYTIIESLVPLKIKKETINVGNVTSYRIKWPEKAISCSYMVQASVNGLLTPWSVAMSVTYPESNGIEMIMLPSPPETIYSIDGIRVKNLRKGIYLLRDVNGKNMKVIR